MKEQDIGYRAPQVCSLVGITYRQLDYWARTGLIRPSVQISTGVWHPASLCVHGHRPAEGSEAIARCRV